MSQLNRVYDAFAYWQALSNRNSIPEVFWKKDFLGLQLY